MPPLRPALGTTAVRSGRQLGSTHTPGTSQESESGSASFPWPEVFLSFPAPPPPRLPAGRRKRPSATPTTQAGHPQPSPVLTGDTGESSPQLVGKRSWWAPVSTSTNDHLSKLLTSALSISHQGPKATTRTSKSSTRPDQERRPNKHLGVASSFLRGHLGTFPCHQEQPPIQCKSAGAGRRGSQGLPQCKPQDPRVVHTLLIAAHQVEGQGSEKAHSLPGDT